MSFVAKSVFQKSGAEGKEMKLRKYSFEYMTKNQIHREEDEYDSDDSEDDYEDEGMEDYSFKVGFVFARDEEDFLNALSALRHKLPRYICKGKLFKYSVEGQTGYFTCKGKKFVRA